MKKNTSNFNFYSDMDDNSRQASPVNAFRVPENYFEQLEGAILKNIQSLPDFEKSSRHNPFTVPEGYFHDLQHQLTEKISSPAPKVPSGIYGNLSGYRLAAILVSACIMILSIHFYTRETLVEMNAVPVTFTELGNTIYLQDLYEDDLVEALAVQQSVAKTESAETDPYIQYLIENHIELSQIASHL